MTSGEEADAAARLRGHELSATNVTVAYDGVDVVHGAAVELRPGEVTVLIGPNGSGKSTLLRAIARLQRARSAEVRIDGDTDASALTSAKRVWWRPSGRVRSRPVRGSVSTSIRMP